MGYEYDQIDDYLDEHGLCELNYDFVVETIGKPHFRNPLYSKKEEESKNNNNMKISYDFVDPSANVDPNRLPPINQARPY